MYRLLLSGGPQGSAAVVRQIRASDAKQAGYIATTRLRSTRNRVGDGWDLVRWDLGIRKQRGGDWELIMSGDATGVTWPLRHAHPEPVDNGTA